MSNYPKKLWYGSDLHLENYPFEELARKHVEFPSEGLFDGVLLAGDIAYSKYIGRHLKDFKAVSDFVVFTPGNHEYWDGRSRTRKAHVTMTEQNESMARQCEELGIHFLNNSHVDIPGTNHTVWGSPWFTDYARLESLRDLSERVCGIGDYQMSFVTPTSRLTPYDHIQMCMEAQDSLVLFLRDCEMRGRTPVVLTHFAPSVRSNHPEYPLDDDYAAYFVTDWLDLNVHRFPAGTTWIHGHTHWNVDYQIGNVRVTSNQRGYLSESKCYDTYFPNKYLEIPST